MTTMQLTITSEEHTYLVGLLEETLKAARVEEHRTRAPTYREHILHREQVIASLLSKLGQPAT